MANPLPSDIRREAPLKVYEAMYEKESVYDFAYKHSLYYPLFSEALQEIHRVGGRKVLEVGCGSGSFAHMLFHRSDFEYHGFDFSGAAIKKAVLRTARPAAFRVSNALASESYRVDYDTIACMEVLEHISADLDVIRLWKVGSNCVCSVPNFDYETHVRYFRNEAQVRSRYGGLVDINRIVRVPRPLFRGRTLREYFRQLRWSRHSSRRFLAHLGYRTFENLAGWFVFSGERV